jgi:eukaryotic-like serine/threonine-protein kinase
LSKAKPNLHICWFSLRSGRSRQAIIRLAPDRVTDSILLSTMQPGQLLCDRYRIEKALARGGFGETFLAVDTHLPSKPLVVVKLLKPIYNDPDTLQIAQRLFNMEAETLEQLGKENDRIPSLFAYFELKGEFYLVQEYIEGETLTKELDGRKHSESDTLSILKEILTGLTNVHREGKIHRDLKPDNIIRRDRDRKLVLIDFGAVKQVKTATTNLNLVSRTINIGTSGYMPNEQGMGYPKPASDIYAVGAIGIQCLTGSAPHLLFDEDSLTIEWQHLCQVNRDIAKILERMIAPGYRDRYADATEALEAIESLISSIVRLQVKPPLKTVAIPVTPTLAINSPTLTRIKFTSVRLDSGGDIVDRPTGIAEIFTEDLGNDLELTMVKIRAGKFIMGLPASEDGRGDEESPQHQVTVSEFYLGQTLVTQAQWIAIMGNNPARFKGNDKLPVEKVSWLDAMDFCQKLSQKTGRTYRLPSEAEWEYACRAGTTTPFAFGETITQAVVNYGGSPCMKGILRGKYRRTTPVGIFPPNLFGLYDLHGNLREWCSDEWIDSYGDAPTDGSARGDISSRDENKRRLLRGGSWIDFEYRCRSAFRLDIDAARRDYTFGFRIVYVS